MSFRYSSNNQGMHCIARGSLLYLSWVDLLDLTTFPMHFVQKDYTRNKEHRMIINQFYLRHKTVNDDIVYFISEVIYGSRISECRGKCQLPLLQPCKMNVFWSFKQLIEQSLCQSVYLPCSGHVSGCCPLVCYSCQSDNRTRTLSFCLT